MTTAETPDEVAGVLEDESDDRVYFQISFSGLRYVNQNACERAVATYFALAAGVDHTNTEYPRACTHGAKAVENRTGLSRKSSVPELVEELLGINALQRPPACWRRFKSDQACRLNFDQGPETGDQVVGLAVLMAVKELYPHQD